MVRESAQASRRIPEESATESTGRRKYLSQTDVPGVPLSQAIRVPAAIYDSYAGSPTKPLRVAEALNMSLSSGSFRTLCGAAIAYGLTDGGSSADRISITTLGKKIVAPIAEGEDRLAMKLACLKPRVINEFLSKYNDHKLPAENIAKNVLKEMGVPQDRAEQTLSLILENARAVGVICRVKDQEVVDLDTDVQADGVESDLLIHGDADEPAGPYAQPELKLVSDSRNGALEASTVVSNRVFVTHGKNKEIVVQLKELLTYGKFDPIVSVEHETVSKPVPDKVLDDMRSCFAAIIHVGTEMKLLDETGQEHRMLNQNVLIEIGAAMALYSHRFILLVERGVTLPSNLQDLYEVRFDGDRLDYDATMKLLKAFNDFRS